MQKKKGISLIVLVITIIVMIILAATIILAINNNNVVEQAKEAVDKTNLKQIQELAQTTWADAYIDGARTKEDLEDAVLEALKDVDTSKYNIEVTEHGVSITEKEVIEKVDFETIIADALANPDKYKHPEQQSTNGDIAIGTDGKAVNMDNWQYQIISDTKQISLSEPIGSSESLGYIGDFTESGEIIGTVPAYIKPAGKDEFYIVTEMPWTFYYCENLKIPPVIPDSVTNMRDTFNNCTKLTEAPIIPEGVTNMIYTFSGCSGLTEAPIIPEGVTDMTSTFADCSKLTEAPIIPEGVTDMSYTFMGCSGLTEAPIIPEGVIGMGYTFSGCSGLTEAPVIPASVINMNSTFFNCIKLAEAPVIPEGVALMGSTFRQCSSLKIAPAIPNTVINMEGTFNSCVNLTTAPVIPEGVTNMSYTFSGCIALTGDLIINAKLKSNTSYTNYYEGCLRGVAKNEGTALVLSGTSPQLSQIYATAYSESNITLAN